MDRWTIYTNGEEIGEYEGVITEGDTIEFGYTECFVLEVDETNHKAKIIAVD